MVIPEIRPHRAFIADALLPLAEPLCALLAFGEGSPFWARMAGTWLEVAFGFQLLAVALALFALAIVVRGLCGERDPNLRFWVMLASAAFFSVVSAHVWYPADAHRSAQRRAEVAIESTRDAVRRYVKRNHALPPDLAALVPNYVSELPNPRVAGSHLTYRRVSNSDHVFELTVPRPGSSKPLASHQEREGLLRRLFWR